MLSKSLHPSPAVGAAALAFAIYASASLLAGEVFPLSRFSMYADARAYGTSHVPVFLADGEPADIRDYRRFSGLDPALMGPGRRICSLGFEVDEAERWVADHTGTEAGPSSVAYGYVSVRLVDGAVVRGEPEIVTRGTAWPR